MKKLIVTLMAFISISAFAKTTEDACLDLSFSHHREKCMDAVANIKFISNAAMNFCTSISEMRGNEVTDCLVGAAGKVYSNAEIKFCKKKMMDSDKAYCMAKRGKKITRVPRTVIIEENRADIAASVKLAQIQKLAIKAKKELRAGDLFSALKKILFIIEISSLDKE